MVLFTWTMTMMDAKLKKIFPLSKMTIYMLISEQNSYLGTNL